ncbi:unnamed protein product [Miscanthus lutarioriparius]|uniref:Uncharacterized protein n=1 Tax=Miscanthus lutarioriparius TaxID=422564 RepID=A0A811QAC7_9POAL|nr:unnamed protein product [Miscanthus lutarioriparius]
MAVPNDKQFLHHPKDHGAFGPFLPALSTPLCHCGLPSFVKQSRHLESARRAFYRGFPYCDFEEYNYGPKSHWPSEYEFAEFEVGIKEWPCTKMPEHKCRCGIKAREGVVPSELRYGYYCGNAYGGPTEFWAGRTCNWEDFPSRGYLVERLKIRSPLEKHRKHLHRQQI